MLHAWRRGYVTGISLLLGAQALPMAESFPPTPLNDTDPTWPVLKVRAHACTRAHSRSEGASSRPCVHSDPCTPLITAEAPVYHFGRRWLLLA